MSTPADDIPETSVEEFLYSVFFNLIAEGTQKVFEHGQFDCQSEDFRGLFVYELGSFVFGLSHTLQSSEMNSYWSSDWARRFVEPLCGRSTMHLMCLLTNYSACTTRS